MYITFLQYFFNILKVSIIIYSVLNSVRNYYSLSTFNKFIFTHIIKQTTHIQALYRRQLFSLCNVKKEAFCTYLRQFDNFKRVICCNYLDGYQTYKYHDIL